MAFVASFLSTDSQGYYYTLVSIASLSLLFEFGLSSVLPTAISHQFLGLMWRGKGDVVGNEVKLGNFFGLLSYSVRWYFIAAFFVLFLLYPLGIAYIAAGDQANSVNWFGPWTALVFSTALSLLINPFLAIIEGSGEVAEVYSVRLIQSFLGGIFTLLAFYLGGELYAASMPAFFSFLIGGIWLVSFKRELVFQSVKNFLLLKKIRKDLFAIQWRTMISWLAGYIMVLMYVPLLFRTQGAMVSGQMALTMNLVNMTSVLATSLLVSRLPIIAINISSKNWSVADSIFRRSMKLSIILYLIGGFLIICLRLILSHTEYSDRMLSLWETFILVMGMGFYHVSGLLASYLRAYLREPMAKILLVIAIVSAFLAIIIAPIWGSYGIVWLVFCMNFFLMFPATFFLYVRLPKEWQNQ